MESQLVHPRWGIEFDWLGVDQHGRVGLFSSAGYGQVPAAVMDVVDALDAEFERLDELPVVGSFVERPSRAGDFSDWVSVAERGIYGFDWRVWDGPYMRVTVPSHPLGIGVPRAVG